MIGRVAGKRALVTGGVRGIGLACARRLIAEGAEVVVTGTHADAGSRTASEIGAQFLVQDVSSEERWLEIADELRGKRLDILVNNAAISGDPATPKNPEEGLLSDLEQIMRVNIGGVFLACKHMIPLMAAFGGGSIVNFGTVATFIPTPGFPAYSASKAAVHHLTLSTALHCAQANYAIRVNTVHPGQVRTEMLDEMFRRQGAERNLTADAVAQAFAESQIPMKVFPEPDDLAALVLFLASDESRYITGQAIACDAGFLLKP